MEKDVARTQNGLWWAALVVCIAFGIALKFYVLAWVVFALGWLVFLLCRSDK